MGFKEILLNKPRKRHSNTITSFLSIQNGLFRNRKNPHNIWKWAFGASSNVFLFGLFDKQ